MQCSCSACSASRFVGGPIGKTGGFSVRFETTKNNYSWLLRLKFALVACTPVAAYAAEKTIRQASMSDITLWTWFFILLMANLGWAIRDLDKLAGWWATEGKVFAEIAKIRLGIIKSLMGANGAGLCTFLLGKSAPQWLGLREDVPEFVLFVAIAVAGYLGAQWFEKLVHRKFGEPTAGE